MGQKSAEMWAVQTDSQPGRVKSDRLLEAGFSRDALFWPDEKHRGGVNDRGSNGTMPDKPRVRWLTAAARPI